MIESVIARFLEEHLDASKGLIVALSGGPDSLCLLHAILAYRQKLFFPLHVAHVDHGWRDESAQEAGTLKDEMAKLGIPFHLKTLTPPQSGNLEAICREERLRFFKEICQQHQCQAVVLGHHADDHAETVLKRVFEGGALVNLSGLQPVSVNNGVSLWRPLLNVKRKEIEAWILQKKLVPFEDRTNRDCKFLRARMRAQLIPSLSAQFGKEVSHNLCHLGDEASQLRSYFSEKLAPYRSASYQGPWGLCVDLSSAMPSHPFELKVLVRQLCEAEGWRPSRSVVETAAGLLLQGAANAEVVMGERRLRVDRGRLFFVRSKAALPTAPLSLTLGIHQWGDWSVSVTEVAEELEGSTWKEAWMGECHAVVPEGQYSLNFAASRAPFVLKSELGRWWTDHRVPAFLRGQVPVVWTGKIVQHEFLTGKKAKSEGPFLRIHLKAIESFS